MDVHVYELLHSLIIVGGVGVMGAVLLVSPVGRALARWIDSKRGGDSAVSGEMEELRRQFEQQNGQIQELEERLDFAERMLSQRRDSNALTEGGK